MEKTTKQLTDDLSKREGVERIIIDPYAEVTINKGDEDIKITGPATILINID